MKQKISKNKFHLEKLGRSKGFVMLYAIVVSAILLSVTLGVTNISLKEVRFSTGASNTNEAFFAADAGIECALYNDKINSNKFPVAGPAVNIRCIDMDIIPTFSPSGGGGVYSFVINGLGSVGQGCSIVTVDKSAPPGVRISSKGYNVGDSSCASSDANRVERELKVLYGGASPLTSYDVVVNFDDVGSGIVTSDPSGISCDSTDPNSSCQYGFPLFSTVTLTASPFSGSTFTGWSGDCSGIGACVLTMDSGVMSVTATFEAGLPPSSRYARSITIDRTKVPNANKTDFPVLINGTYSYLATEANGGKVKNSNGYDIGFYADANLMIPLKWEQEKYVATTGEIAYWVKVPTLNGSSSGSNTVIYMGYGDSSITSDQSDKNNTWNSNFATVWHMDGVGTSVSDSTSSPTSPSKPASWGWESSSKVSNGLTWTAGSSGSSIGSGKNDGTDWTIEFWYKGVTNPPAGCVGNDFSVVYTNNWGGLTVGNLLDVLAKQIEYTDYNNGSSRTGNTTTFGNGIFDHYTLNADWDGGGAGTSRFRIFKNGAFLATWTKSNDSLPSQIRLGSESGMCQVGASIDEFRVTNNVLADDWIITNYNSQNSPDTFYTVGTEQSI